MFETEKETFYIPVSIDVKNQKVFFDSNLDESLYDPVILERDILNYMKPQSITPPNIPEEVLQMIGNVRAGNYNKDME